MKFSDLTGIFGSLFRLGGFGADAVNLKADTGGFVRARNADDSADTDVIAATFRATGDDIELNTDAAGSGDDWKYGLGRPAAGQTEDLQIIFPVDKGSAAQALFTDGNGNTYWGSAAGATNLEATDTTTLSFGSSSPLAMFALPANAIVAQVKVIIDTAFDGTPSLSIGVAGQTSKYMPATYIDLTQPAGTIFESEPGLAAVGTVENLIATYAAGGATVGSARILVSYVIPS